MRAGNTQRTTSRQKARQIERIAFVVSKFPCIDETFILREMAVLASNGFDLEIYSIKKSRDAIIQTQAEQLQDRLIYRRYFFSTAVLDAQIHFLRISPARYFKTLFSFMVEMWRAPVSLLKCLALFPKAVCYSKLMQQRQTTHIHAAWASYPCAIAWVAHHLAALPYSFSAHAHDIYQESSMLLAKLQKAEFVLTCTAFNRKHLSALVPDRANSIEHIYHGLDLQKFRQDAGHHKNDNGTLRILSIGTLYKTKGFDVLIKACALLKQDGIPFQCKIVGDGPERNNLQRCIAMHGLREHVLLLGYLEQEALRPLRQWSNIFILLPRPHLHWGLPNVFIESLASKLAVIATPVNAVSELVRHEETGLIVESDNPKATAEALLRMQQFPDDRRRMAEAGQQLAYRLFDVQKTSQQLAAVFRKALKGRDGKGEVDKRIKVLHVIEDLEAGGAERVLTELVLGLNRTEFEPMVCCLRDKGKMAGELDAEKIPVFAMHKQHKIDLALLYRLQKFMRVQQIDIVHTHVFTANLWGRLAARFANVPVVISHEHSTFTADHWLYRRLETVLSKKTDCTIAVSNQLRNLLLDRARLQKDRVRTIYNGLKICANGDVGHSREKLSCGLGLEKFETVIGSVGRLDPRKNYDILLRAFCALLQKKPNAGLLIAGSGPEDAGLRSLARNLRLGDNVVFAGHRDDVPALLEQMSVFCLPSQTEGISLALLEAMAAAVPVVATRVGGNPEIIVDETFGLLVPPNDVAALAGALQEALGKREESQKRARNAARRVREDFSHTAMMQNFEALYRELVSGKSHGKRGIAVS